MGSTDEKREDRVYVHVLNIGRRAYFFDVCRNDSGLYLRIVEKRGDRRNAIIIPSTHAAEFVSTLARALATLPADGSE